jgi:hypothetical protein
MGTSIASRRIESRNMTHRHSSGLSREGIRSLMICQNEKDALKRLQAETAGRQALHAPLDALLPALLDRAFKGSL